MRNSIRQFGGVVEVGSLFFIRQNYRILYLYGCTTAVFGCWDVCLDHINWGVVKCRKALVISFPLHTCQFVHTVQVWSHCTHFGGSICHAAYLYLMPMGVYLVTIWICSWLCFHLESWCRFWVPLWSRVACTQGWVPCSSKMGQALGWNTLMSRNATCPKDQNPSILLSTRAMLSVLAVCSWYVLPPSGCSPGVIQVFEHTSLNNWLIKSRISLWHNMGNHSFDNTSHDVWIRGHHMHSEAVYVVCTYLPAIPAEAHWALLCAKSCVHWWVEWIPTMRHTVLWHIPSDIVEVEEVHCRLHQLQWVGFHVLLFTQRTWWQSLQQLGLLSCRMPHSRTPYLRGGIVSPIPPTIAGSNRRERPFSEEDGHPVMTGMNFSHTTCSSGSKRWPIPRIYLKMYDHLLVHVCT